MKYGHLLLLLATGLVLSCDFKKPAAPSWDLPLNIPMIDRTYPVSELIEGEKNLSGGKDGLLSFKIEKEIDTTFVGHQLTLPDMQQTINLGLDAFEIPDLPVQADRYFFYQLTEEAAAKNGSNSTIAPFAFNNLPAQEHSSADLHYAVLQKGRVRLHIFNYLPVPLRNVLLTLEDPLNGYLIIASPLIGKINALDSTSVEMDIAGKTFPPNSRWLISGDSPGSNGGVISIDQNARVEVLAEMLDSAVSSLEARLPAVTIDREESISFDGQGSTAIEEVAFASGQILVTIDNQTPFSAYGLTLSWLELHPVGIKEPLRLKIDVKPFSRSQGVLDLKSAIATMKMPQVGQVQYFNVAITGRTEALVDQFTRLDDANTLQITLQLRDLQLDHFSGRLQEQKVRLDSTFKAIELSDRLGDLTGVRLSDARLRIELYHTICIPLRFQGTLIAFSDGGEKASLSVDQVILPGTTAGETETQLAELTPQNSDLLSFINIAPTRLSAGGQIQIGDGLTYGQVRKSDYLRGRYLLDLPAYASWERRDVESDWSQFTIDPENAPEKEGGDKADISGDVTSHLTQARLVANIDNHLPIGGEVRFYFSTDSTRLFDLPELILGPVALTAAPVDAGGRVSSVKTQTIVLEIAGKDVSIFQNKSDERKCLYIAEKLTLDGTAGKQVKIYVDDYVHIAGLLQVEAHISDQ